MKKALVKELVEYLVKAIVMLLNKWFRTLLLVSLLRIWPELLLISKSIIGIIRALY